jgi:hypothetical protein
MIDMTRMLMALVALTLALASPAMAQSPNTNAPPGNSAIDEYLETVPDPGGDSHPGPPGGDGGGATDGAQQQKLARMGPDGRALARLVATTAPAAAGTDGTHRGKAAGDATASAGQPVALSLTAAHAGSPVGAALAAAAGRDDGGGLGLLLPAILLATLVGVIVLVVMRRRPRAS